MDWFQTDVSSNQITSIDDFITKYAAGTVFGYIGNDCNVAFAFDGKTSYLKMGVLVVALQQSVLHQRDSGVESLAYEVKTIGRILK